MLECQWVVDLRFGKGSGIGDLGLVKLDDEKVHSLEWVFFLSGVGELVAFSCVE